MTRRLCIGYRGVEFFGRRLNAQTEQVLAGFLEGTVVAGNYVKLALELYDKEEYDKAESYLKSAREIYERGKHKEKIVEVERQIARAQEAQNKISEAIFSYKNAGRLALSPQIKQLNSNDASRLWKRWTDSTPT